MNVSSIKGFCLVLTGVVGYAAAWELIGQFGVFGRSWPSLSSVLATATSSRYFDVLLEAIGTTSREAAMGYAIGVAIAAGLGAITILLNPLARGITRFAAIANAIPPIILGPLLMATVDKSNAPIVLSALVVTFGVFVALLAGLNSTMAAHEDLFATFGASRMTRLLRLQVPTAVPYFVDGLKMAGPSALLGAVLAEWFGTEFGIGPIFVAAMQNYQITLLWSAALACAAASMLAFGLLSIVQRAVRERFV